MILFQRHGGSKSLWRIFSAAVGLFVSLDALNAPLSLASQSSIQQRTSYNSEKQLTYFVAGTWGFNERAFGNASFTHSRTPISALGRTDTFYQASAGVGYAIDNLAFDGGVNLSKSPLPRISSRGGYLGLTYIFIPPDTDASTSSEQALSLFHTQIYTKSEQAPPLFWTRLSYVFNSMTSQALTQDGLSGRETTFTLDAYYPLRDDILLSAGIGFHGYEDPNGFFAQALRDQSNLDVQLLGSTIQGLPHTTLSASVAWQLAPRDTLMPRYQATEIDSTRTWTHTFDFAWRHQFGKPWYVTPTYEVTVQGQQAITGFILDIVYVF